MYNSGDWEKATKYTDDTNLNNFITGDFSETVEDLKSQADKKAETWYQSADPALNWTAAQKTEHKGDLWYDISRQRTYRYNGTGWDESKTAPPDSVFDRIDGKAQIFIAQPIPPYSPGDMWVTSTENGKAAVKICKTGRSDGGYAAADWIDTKYVDASDIAGAITEYDTSLGQGEVFNKLTNGGVDQGIYIKDGKLYINADYILSGILAGKFINAKGINVKDKDNNTTFYVDDAGNVTIRATSFSLSGKSVQDIANNAASGALTEAKDYADSILGNIKPNLTQQEIFNILTNNGATQGIYLYSGKIYINASYIDTGNLAGWTVGSTSLSCTAYRDRAYYYVTLDASYAKVQTNGPFSVYGGDGNARMEGCKVYGDMMECVILTTRSQGSSTFNHVASFYQPPKIYGLSHVSSGGHLVFASDGSTLAYLSSSSRRYKDHLRRVEMSDVHGLYKLPVVYFKYRDGYLDEKDRMVGKAIPGFYAENVRLLYPDGVRYDDEGYAEDWNERTLIPAMLKLIQEQKKEIDALRESQTALEQRIAKLETLIGGVANGN